MSNDPQRPSQSAAPRSAQPHQEAADLGRDPHQLRRMSWRAEGAQDYPGGALERLLEISQRKKGQRRPGGQRC